MAAPIQAWVVLLLRSAVAAADGASWAAVEWSTSTSCASPGFTVTGGTAAGDALGGTAPVALGSVGAGEGGGVLALGSVGAGDAVVVVVSIQGGAVIQGDTTCCAVKGKPTAIVEGWVCSLAGIMESVAGVEPRWS